MNIHHHRQFAVLADTGWPPNIQRHAICHNSVRSAIPEGLNVKHTFHSDSYYRRLLNTNWPKVSGVNEFSLRGRLPRFVQLSRFPPSQVFDRRLNVRDAPEEVDAVGGAVADVSLEKEGYEY